MNKETPAKTKIVEEFFEQLEHSKAKNNCIMLPGNLQYWTPNKTSYERGVKDI